MRLSASKSSASSFYSGLGEQLYDLSGARPALDLNFASNGSLVDSVTGKNLVTHTRASNATYVDGDGIIKDAVTNLALSSEEFDNAGWTKGGNTTVTANYAAAPNGTFTADRVEMPNAFGTVVTQTATVTSGRVYTFSIYARATAASSDFIVNFGGNSISPTLTEQWQRYSVTATATSGSLDMEIDNGSAAVDFLIWGAQLEQSSTAGEYVKTTSTINSAPRFDHNPTTGESLGLLIEEARTNLVPSSNGFGSFSVSDASRQSGHTGPDGSQDAYKITSTTSTTYSRIFTFHNSTAGTVVTFSVYLKVDSGSLSQQACIALGSTAVYATKNITLTTNWQRFDITGTVPSDALEMANPLIYLNPDDDSGAAVTDDYLYIFGAQLEAGSFPTSYIRTEGSTVTRSADVASITGTNFSSWYNQTEGTVFSEFRDNPETGSESVFSLSDGTYSNRFSMFATSNANSRIVSAGVGASPGTLALSSVAVNKYALAARVQTGGAIAAGNGILSSSATPSAMPTVNRLYLGVGDNGSSDSISGTIARLTYWPTRLSNDTLQTITR